MYEQWTPKKIVIHTTARRKFPKRGEIWMCEFGENIGSEQNLRRPCVVISNHTKKENTCVIIPASRTPRNSSCIIGRYNFLVHQIRTIDTKRLDRFVERLNKKDTDAVINAFIQFLGE